MDKTANKKGIICYYSGSGNTKLACEYLAKKITQITFDFFNMVKDGTPDLEKYQVVGFAAFADAWEPSFLFRSFVNNLPSQNNKPAFVFNTYGFISGKTLKIMDELATAKGFKVITGHSLHTPENYPPMIAAGLGCKNSPNKKEMQRFVGFIAGLDRLIGEIVEGKNPQCQKVKIGLFNTCLPSYPRNASQSLLGDNLVDETLCTGCGVCAKLCPYQAIHLNPKPVFDIEKCHICWSCYNHCPNQAIYTKKYRGIGHYPRPNELLREKLKI